MCCRTPILVVALAGLAAVLLCNIAPAATIGYWRFEGTEPGDWLLDSSGSANQHNLVLQGSPLQYTLPETGRGSAFPNPIPLTGQPNLTAAQLDQSGTKQWFTAPDHDDFTFATALTVEAFLNIDNTSGSTVVAGHWDGSSANQRSWFLDIVGGSGALRVYLSPNGSSAVPIASSLSIEAGKDYFVAASVELAESGVSNSGTVTFHVKNLTDGGPMLSDSKSHSTSSLHNSTKPLAIGSRSRSGGHAHFPGIIDEVRLTEGALNSGQLLSPNSLYFSRDSGRTEWGNTTPNVWATTSGGPDYDQPWSDGANAHFEDTGGTVTVSGTIDSVNSMAFEVGGYTLSGGTITLTGDATIYAGDQSVYGSWTNISTKLTGSAGLTKTGPGDIVLRSASTDYSGGTFIHEGRIVLGDGDDRLPTGTTVTLGSADKSGALHLGWGTGTPRNQTLAGLVTSGTGTENRVAGAGSSTTFSTLTLNIAGTNVFDGILGGPGSGENRLNLIKTGAGTLTLSGINTYVGATEVTGTGILRAGSNQAFGDNSALTVGSDAVVELNGWSLAVGSIAGSGIVRNAPGSESPGSDHPTVFTVGGNHDSTEFSGVLQDGEGGVPLGLRKVGAAELILRGESTYSGNTAIEDGRLVLGSGTDRLPVGTTVTLGGGTASGELSLGAHTTPRAQTLAGLITSGTGTGNRVVGAGSSGSFSTLTLNIDGTNDFDGFLGGPGPTEDRLNLTKTGAGTLTLLSANTHVGDTRVNAGTLALGHVDALQNSTLDTGSSGSQQVTFAVAGTNTYNLGGLKGSNALDFGADSISLGSNDQTTTFSGNLTATGTLTKVGDGRLSLAGEHRNFSGHTQIENGILRLMPSTGHQFPSSFDVAPDGELQLGGTAGVNLSGSITGSGPIHLLDGGFYRFSGNNSFTSDFTLDGRLRVGSSTALGNVNNAVTMGSSASLELYGWNAVIGSLAGSGIVQNRSDSGSGSVAAPVLTTGGNNDSTVFSGVIQDGSGNRPVGLLKEGTGVFTLTGDSTYTGATVVNAGTLLVHGSLENTSGVTVSAGATLGGSGLINATVDGAGLVSPGGNPGILTIGQFDPSGGLDTALEFTAVGPPVFDNAEASDNDLLRITGAVPFTQPLDPGNVVDVYFDIAGLTAGDTVLGGFYTDAADGFLAAIENATLAYWVADDGLGTDRMFNDRGYYSLENYASWLTVDISTLAMQADFGAGPVFGRIAQFAVVPEPGAALLLLSALAFALTLRRRRRGR